jgi:hypothetical protein
LGAELVRRDIELVYGGASVGLMAAVADAVIDAGGHVIGVIPDGLVRRELAHGGLVDLRHVGTMHERKALMAELSDGFVAMPGGLGTFEELFEMVTWSQLGIHEKPVGLLNVGGYFSSLLALVDHAIDESFIPDVHRDLILADTDASILIDRMAGWQAPNPAAKWDRPRA